MAFRHVSVRHWLPILTICPVNNLPDLIYVTVDFIHDAYDVDPEVEFPLYELYGVRKQIRQLASGKKMFMEDIAALLYKEIKGASSVTVTLLFGRHAVTHGDG